MTVEDTINKTVQLIEEIHKTSICYNQKTRDEMFEKLLEHHLQLEKIRHNKFKKVAYK